MRQVDGEAERAGAMLVDHFELLGGVAGGFVALADDDGDDLADMVNFLDALGGGSGLAALLGDAGEGLEIDNDIDDAGHRLGSVDADREHLAFTDGGADEDAIGEIVKLVFGGIGGSAGNFLGAVDAAERLAENVLDRRVEQAVRIRLVHGQRDVVAGAKEAI